MSNSRRQFLRDASLTVTGAVMIAPLQATKKSSTSNKAVSCGPLKSYALDGTIASARSGKWSDAATWGGRIPVATDTPLIQSGHTITYDMEATVVAGLNIAATAVLAFDNGITATLESTANIVVEGKLQMKPAAASILQTIRFTGVTEDKFTGGGMDVLAADIGLWVMGNGQLDLSGSTKTSWTRATGSIASGATTISVENADGWQPGDEISIAPTESPAAGAAFTTGFDERTIKSVSGNMIELATATGRAHPMVNGQWTAEVMNLTRNLRIEGTAGGRAHIFIRSAATQHVQNVAIRYMGPRKDRSGDGVKELVAGRYGLHFHHCDEGSRGSQVIGNVVRDTGNHSYVPHVSHGVTFRDNIAYNVMEIAFWWDPGDLTHSTLYDHNIVANCKFVPASLNMNAEDAPTFSSSGFLMTTGDDNICKNCVVVGGALGDAADGGAYNWEATLHEGVWTFIGNMAHNNDCGLRVWQNSTRNHVIEDFTAYYNGTGIFHGAYANSYTYNGGVLYGNGMTVKAASVNSNRVRIENYTIDGANLIDYGLQVIHSPLPGERPVFVRNVTIRNCRVAALIDSAEPEVHSTDIIQSNISGAIMLAQTAVAGETIRVQPTSGQPYQITKAGQGDIGVFAATVWGNGKGLKGEYFNSNNFTNLAFTRIDSNVSFTEWSDGVHHLITGNNYSVRWTGRIQAQYSETYTFFLGSGGGHRLWIDNKLILDSWQEHYPDVYQSSPITLEAGKVYDLRLEYYNTDAGTGMGLFWQSKSLPLEYVPQSQLFSDEVVTPGNVLPIANAGADITITLPVNNVTLDGTASSDPDGTITAYQWTKISGPAQFTIADGAAVKTTVTDLVAGIYVFRLQVTDDKGATHTDDVTVTVQAAPAGNQAPVANAGPDITITLPVDNATLNGSASTDADGSIASYMWSKVSGPSQFNISNGTSASPLVSNLVQGVYTFRLIITDDKGAIAQDDVTVTVKEDTGAVNKPPVANAGSDITIMLPVESVFLNGNASYDPDGSIASYKWTKVSGPSQFGLVNPEKAVTAVITLTKGTYVFRLTVTDDKGASATDDVTVVVIPGKTPDEVKPLTVSVTPNPSSNIFRIKVSSSSNLPVTIRLFDNNGRLVQRFLNLGNNVTVVAGSGFIKGTYVVVVEQGRHRSVRSVLKL